LVIIVNNSDAQDAIINTLSSLHVVDAKTEESVTFQQLWKESKVGVLLVWLRHFG
jgi:hypothetical protein